MSLKPLKPGAGDPPAKCVGYKATDFDQALWDAVKPFGEGKVWSLYISGTHGTGKSCFAATFLHYWRIKDNPQAVWMDCDVLERVMKHFNSWPSRLVVEANRPLLILDDLGKKSRTDYISDQYVALITLRYRQNLPTLITSNKSMSELATYLDPSIPSRLQQGIVIEMNGKDRRA